MFPLRIGCVALVIGRRGTWRVLTIRRNTLRAFIRRIGGVSSDVYACPLELLTRMPRPVRSPSENATGEFAAGRVTSDLP